MAVLTIIAGHYRFGRNGHGCYASQRRLAELLDCRQATVQEALGLLEAAGYIEVSVDERDCRRRTYRVIYTEDDWRAFNPKRGRGSDLAGKRRIDTPQRIKSEPKNRPSNDTPQRIKSAAIDTVQRIDRCPPNQKKRRKINAFQRVGGSRIYSAKQEEITQKLGSPTCNFAARPSQETERRSGGERSKLAVGPSDPKHVTQRLNGVLQQLEDTLRPRWAA